MKPLKYTRGSVWWYNRQSDEIGITRGEHPCVIVSSDEWNAISGSVIIVPCTTERLKGTSRNLTLDLGKSEGKFFPTQLTTVPKMALHDFQGIMGDDEMRQLDDIIQCVLGQCNYKALDHYINTEERVKIDSRFCTTSAQEDETFTENRCMRILP